MLKDRLENLMTQPLVTGAVNELRDLMLDLIENHMEKPLQTRRLIAENAELSS